MISKWRTFEKDPDFEIFEQRLVNTFMSAVLSASSECKNTMENDKNELPNYEDAISLSSSQAKSSSQETNETTLPQIKKYFKTRRFN